MSNDKPSSTTTSVKSQSFEDRLKKARGSTLAAFKVLKLLTNGKAHLCPACSRQKVKIFANATWQCRRCGTYGGPRNIQGGSKSNPNALNTGNAIDLVMFATGKTFTEAIDILLNETAQQELEEIDIEPDFQANIDSEVYQAVLDSGSLERAKEFYGRWMISPEAVETSGCTYIESPVALAKDLIKQFGKVRLAAAGLLSQKGQLLISPRYCVIEPQLGLDGKPKNLQFRAGPEQEAKLKEYAEYKREKALAEETGSPLPPSMRFVPKFMSLLGATSDSRVGFGLPAISRLSPSSTVWIVEGMKDVLAANSLRLNSYGLPGIGVMPQEDAVKVLARLHIKIAYDGDDGGTTGRQALVRHFRKYGIVEGTFTTEEVKELSDLAKKIYKYRRKQSLTLEHRFPPEGSDMTDVLISKRQGI